MEHTGECSATHSAGLIGAPQEKRELGNGLKYRWYAPVHDDQHIAELSTHYNISAPVIQTLVGRGYVTPEAIHAFLFAPYNAHKHHPSQLKDATRAVERIMQACTAGEKILIAGDYDVDGITSTALMIAALSEITDRVNFFLPHRVRDGYGLSVQTVERAARNGYTLIITVDNGITACEPAARARALGVDLIITDHHRPHDTLPEAYAIVNPCQEACTYPFKALAGVGVAFKVISLLFEMLGKDIPEKVYELLLLGTVADVVPLREENRYWVRYGLRAVNTHTSTAIEVLKRNAHLQTALSSLDIGFSLAPQLNALGRLEDPRQGVSFLLSDDRAQVEHTGRVLHELNQARKAIEKQVLEDIQAQLSAGVHNSVRDRCIIACGDNWPPGVVGLVAGRLVSLYNVPALVLHTTKDGVCKGSARAPEGVHLFHALESCKDLLIQFGGHAQAAGLAIRAENIDALRACIRAWVIEHVGAEHQPPSLLIDASLRMTDVHAKLVRDVSYLEPFGCENPQPTFVVHDVSLLEPPSLLKEQHTKALLFADGVIKPVIFFNRPDIYHTLLQQQSATYSVAVRVVENSWNDKKSIEFHGVDIALW